MENISFKLDVFEGPLDLLLHLISKHKLNINDIEISKLLEQYLIYIEQAKEQDLELAGEFLEMAARLILGIAAAISPVAFIMENVIDIVILIAMSIMVLLFAWSRQKINRMEGAIMLLSYAGYMVYICMR